MSAESFRLGVESALTACAHVVNDCRMTGTLSAAQAERLAFLIDELSCWPWQEEAVR